MFTNLINLIVFWVTAVIAFSGYWGIFLMMTAESACIPIPSEVIMPFAGFLVVSGKLNFWLVVIAGTIGNLVGSWLAYWLGTGEGYNLLRKYGKYILISHHDLDKAHSWFEKRGEIMVFFSRLLPVVRTFISLPAGVARMNLKKFTFFTFLGSLLWAIGLTYLGTKMGENWNKIQDYFHKFDLLIGAILILGIVWYIRRHIKNNSKLKS